jgi:hypothetical protein
MHVLMARHGVLFHAAAVRVRSGVLMIAGPKGGGKSTLQVQLATAGAALVSADRTYLCPGKDDQMVAVGYPARMSLRRDTFSRYPQLGDPDCHVEDGPSKVLMSLPEAARRLGTSLGGGGRLAGIVVVQRRTARGPLLSKPTKSGVRRCLQPHRIGGRDPIVRRWLEVSLKQPPLDLFVRRTLARTVAAAPVYQINTMSALAAGARDLLRVIENVVAPRGASETGAEFDSLERQKPGVQ